MTERWKPGHLLVDDSNVRVDLSRSDLLLEAHNCKGIDDELSDDYLEHVQVLDLVDSCIRNMMKRGKQNTKNA